LSRIPFGRALQWAKKKGGRYVQDLLDKLRQRKPDVEAPIQPKPPKKDGGSPDKGPEDPKKPDASEKPDDPKKPDDDAPKQEQDKADQGSGQDENRGSIVKEGNKTTYTNPAGNELSWVDQSPKDINRDIDNFLSSSNVGKATEAKVANFVRDETEVKGFGQKVLKHNGEAAGDLDVVTEDAIIEVKASIKAVKEDQFNKFTDASHDLFFNPENKKVILYIDKPLTNLRPEHQMMLENIKSKGVTIVNSLEDLKGVIK